MPQEITISDVITDENGNNFKLLHVIYSNGTKEEHLRIEENGMGEYSLPIGIAITNKVENIETTEEIPIITYLFELNSSNEYELQTDISIQATCTVSSLEIKEFEKIELLDTSNKATTITKYPADPAPLVENYVYAINNETGEYEKFLAAYHKSEGAQNQLNSIDTWLYDMMEGNEATVEFVDSIKYLLYMYDGVDRGVIELDLSIFDSSKFSTLGGIYGNNIEEKIWFALIGAGYSEYAAAGAMGNFFAESGLRTNNLEDSYETKLSYTDQAYTQAINDGSYTLEQFISDHELENCGAGYGLAQWTFGTRKEGLYNFAKSKDVSIDNEDMQIEYLLGELGCAGNADGYASYQLSPYKGYTVDDWQNATSPETAAEAFCWIFEKPTSYNSTRSDKAKEYYDRYQGKTRPQGENIQADNGDGYSQKYTSSTGRTYREYKQWMGSYASNLFVYYSPETVAQSGCSITAIATITSGYNNNQTPGTLSSEVPYLAQLLEEGGTKCTRDKADANKLTTGKPALVPISGVLTTERGSKYYSGHFIAILDARNGNEVYVSDPGANDAVCGGWTNIENIINIVNGSVLYVDNQ